MRPGRTRASLRAAFAFDKFTRKNLSGEQASFPPAPHDCKTCPQINIELWRKHQNTPLLDAETQLVQTREETTKLAAKFSEEYLFTRGHFGFTGNTAYATCSASSRYDLAKR